MTMPRLAPDGVGRGCFMPCVALRGPLYGVLCRENIGTLLDEKCRVEPVNALYSGFSFWGLFRSAEHGRKNDACGPLEGLQAAGRWRGVYRRHGQEKTRPRKPRTGTGGIQDFFAVSQIIIIGSSRINRIIKRGSPPFSGGRVKPDK